MRMVLPSPHTRKRLFCRIILQIVPMTSPLQEYDQQPLVPLEQALQPLSSMVPGLQQMFETIQSTDRSQALTDSLSWDESASVMLYTLKWKTPQTSFQYFFNESVRSQDHQQIQPWLLYLRLFLHALSKSPPSSSSTAYRAVTMDTEEEYIQGEEFICWGFVSCTSILQFPDDQSGVMFIIECDTARDISRYSLDRNTDEILLYPGRKFRVISSLDYPNRSKIIQLRELDQYNPSFQPPQPAITPNQFSIHLQWFIDQHPPETGVDLNDYPLSESDLQMVIEHALIEKQCSKLLLSGTRLTASHISILVNRLTMNTTLKFLSLSYNNLTDQGVRPLMRIFEENQCQIETLGLHATGITDRLVEDLARMLKKNTTLRWLHLGGNQISDRSIPLLTEVLIDHNHTLRALDLSYNEAITHTSIGALANMLEKSSSLETFWINDCKLLTEDKRILEKIVQDSRKFFLLFVHSVRKRPMVQ